MDNVKLVADFSHSTGKIKPMHAVGQPPMVGINCMNFKYLKDANIPYSRLHDVGTWKLRPMVDISCIFPDMAKDENNPESYDFEYTDLMIRELIKADCYPVFRLGETIENAISSGYKPRYVFAPKDPYKWAKVCEHIVRHYNEGWADGYNFGITYWEIWNEPDNGFQEPCGDRNMMWVGTDEQYYELYSVTSKHLKSCFGDKIKVGGYGSSGLYGIFNNPEKYGIPQEYNKYYSPRFDMFVSYFYAFLEYIKKENAPLDFYSWHSYSDVDRTAVMGDFVAKTLEEHGYGNVEIHLNEWNNAHSLEGKGTSYACAHAAAMMLSMQNSKNYMLNFYDARLGVGAYSGMFDSNTFKPCCLYYGFKAFGELYGLGNAVECNLDGKDIYAVAATDGENKVVLISNIGGDKEISTNLKSFDVYLIDQENFMEKIDLSSENFEIKENQVILIKNY